MNSSKKKGILSKGWVVFGIVIAVVAGARLIHPGGIRGIINDSYIEANSNPKTQDLRDKMLRTLIPIGATVLCMKKYGNTPDLEDAIERYNIRNELAMKKLISDIDVLGGLSSSEKGLIDRLAYQRAEDYIGVDGKQVCLSLSNRIDSGEFDLSLSE